MEAAWVLLLYLCNTLSQVLIVTQCLTAHSHAVPADCCGYRPKLCWLLHHLNIVQSQCTHMTCTATSWHSTDIAFCFAQKVHLSACKLIRSHNFQKGSTGKSWVPPCCCACPPAVCAGTSCETICQHCQEKLTPTWHCPTALHALRCEKESVSSLFHRLFYLVAKHIIKRTITLSVC